MTLVSSSSLCVFLCWACAHSARVQQHLESSIETEAQHTSAQKTPGQHTSGQNSLFQNSWGRNTSCEKLHSRFRMRSDNLQSFVNSYTEADEMGLAGQGRAMMKASAVLRALRRGGDCAWVNAGSDEDIEAVGKVLRSVLANNPCAPAALAELQLLDTDREEGSAPLPRAMSILMSDSCEVQLQGQESDEIKEIVLDIDDVETEELVQDGVEEMIESEDTTSSLVERSDMQSSHSWAQVGKLMGAIMLGVLFVLGCGYAAGFVGFFVGFLFSVLLLEIRTWTGSLVPCQGCGAGFLTVFFGVAGGAVIGGAGGAALCGTGFYRAVNASSFLLPA